MILFKKIRASAMQFAILVSTIIAILLGSFLTLTYTRQFFRVQSDLFLSTIEKSNEGIYFGLQPKNSFRDSISIEAENVVTTIKKEYWGGFEMLESSSKAKTKSFTKVGLTGAQVSKPCTSIYVSDSQLPLVLVGDTQIEGTAYISSKGIKPGTIAGHYYTGKKLINGNIHTSSELPKLEEKWIQNIKKLLNYVPSNKGIVVERQAGVATNSFFEETKHIYEGGALKINETLIGNIIIKSDTEIVVSASAKLTDVIVVAPKITIESGFTGNASFIANERIHLEKNVTLTYPSAVVVLDDSSNETPVSSGEEPIFISGDTTVSGILVYLSNKDKPESGRGRSEPNITIEPDATLEGMVYCQGNTELSGTVIGSVYTERFVAKEFGSVYVNHIYNGQVLGNDIDPNYCGLPFKKTKKGIVKWLY